MIKRDFWFLSLKISRIISKFLRYYLILCLRDQLRLLKYDNIASGKYKTNSDIGTSKRYFNDEVKKYCYMWREGGQFSTDKYNSNKNLENKSSKLKPI